MAERRLGESKLGGRVRPYVPRGAQYDYNPPSVFTRHKFLTALFIVLALGSFTYWALIMRQPRAAPQWAAPVQQGPVQQVPPAADPVYVEPLRPR